MPCVIWCAGYSSHDVRAAEQASDSVTAAVQTFSRHHAAAAAAADLITAFQWTSTSSQILVRVSAVDQAVGQSPTGRHRDDDDSNPRNTSRHYLMALNGRFYKNHNHKRCSETDIV